MIHTTARAASPSPRTSASASVASTNAATASWSCSGSRSDRPVPMRWSATRASRSCSRASARRSGSPGWRYPCATRPGDPAVPASPVEVAERDRRRPAAPSPPSPAPAGRAGPRAPDFRSGSSISATAPGRSNRSSAAAASAPTSRSRRRGRELLHPLDQLGGQVGVAGDETHVEQRGERVEVVVGDGQRLLHRADRLTEDESGIPERIPECAGVRRPTARPGDHRACRSITSTSDAGTSSRRA